MFYNTWEDRIADWYAGRPMGTWSDPNETPLLNSINPQTNSKDYVPEPWWGNHDINTPLHSVVINFNPGQGGDIQLHSAIPYKCSYAKDIVDSGYLPKTGQWHENRRALPVLNALKNIGILPPSYKPSVNNHLSVELIPWHTENAGARCGFTKYLKENILSVYEYSICFAANESKRIANPKLSNVVILKLSGTKTKKLLELLDGIGYASVIKSQQTAPSGQSHCLEFSIKRLPGVRFCSIWGSKSRNNFPSQADLEYVLNHYI